MRYRDCRRRSSRRDPDAVYRDYNSRHGSAAAQLFSLIWLSFVKRAECSFPKISFSFRLVTPRTMLSQQQGRHDCGFNAEMRESTPNLRQGVINRSRSEAALVSV